MNHQEKERIKRILASEDKQTDVDITKIIATTKKEVDEQMMQNWKEQLVQKRMPQYPTDNEENRVQ